MPENQPNNNNKDIQIKTEFYSDEKQNQDINTNEIKSFINPYLIHLKLQYGKKFYWSEFLSENFIRVIALLSIAFILAIFFYVFQESIYAFVEVAKGTNETVTEQNNSGDTGLQPQSYGSEDNADDLKQASYGDSESTNELKPETYGTEPSAELKPESYGSSPDVNIQNEKADEKSVQPTEANSIEKGRDASQSVESAGSDRPLKVSDLVYPNDKIDGKNAYIWQPISQVPKYNIIPLAVGALKVTVIGLFISAPIAILAALFTVAFAPKWMREIMKPAIEILAGFPSVVIGFFCLMVVASVTQKFFGSTYRLNAFVGGFGMALAVIPIIYTITEDALSAVPKFMKEASFALGASRWQTAIRVTLPAATPGVFAALILGFGRAFGETMIALMATGNAALLSGNIFESVRTLAATIGAEMAEVEFHSVHYGVLFLIGAILFVITFSLNAIAEFYVRNKLMKKFQGK